MPYPPISALPAVPSRSQSPTTFSADADAFLGALPDFRTDANTLGAYFETQTAAVEAIQTDVNNTAAAVDDVYDLVQQIVNANYLGAYNPATTYQIGDAVNYLGGFYIASTINTGIAPIDGANWYYLARGEVSLDGVQTLTNKTFRAPVINAYKSDVIAVAASTVNCSLGNYFTKTASGPLSWAVSNVPSGSVFSFILELTNGGTGAQTWFSGIKWPGGVAPTLTASGVDLLGFITDDNGTTWRGVQLMKDSR